MEFYLAKKERKKKEQTTDTCDNNVEAKKHYNEQRKSLTKDI